jgi:hypothetical protein
LKKKKPNYETIVFTPQDLKLIVKNAKEEKRIKGTK